MAPKIILLCIILISQSVFAIDDSVTGEGKFLATDSDGVKFIKDQLLYEATKDVISKELDSMGLNRELFWQKYDAKLESIMEIVDRNLQTEYKIGTEGETKVGKERYKKDLRHKKLARQLKFGGLSGVISSYAIRRQSRSSQNPQLRFMKIEAKVMRDRLSEIYYRFVRGRKSSDYGKLYLQLKYKLYGITFTEMGIENEANFVKDLGANWLEKLSANKPNNITNVEILTDDLNEKLEGQTAYDITQTYENTPDEFVNSLLLTIYVDINKAGLDTQNGRAHITYDGGMALRDLQTGLVVDDATFSTGREEFEFTAPKDIGQRVINYIYRMPMTEFVGLAPKIEKLGTVSMVEKVYLYNYKNYQQILAFQKLLEQKGVKYSLRSELSSLGPTSSELIILMDGKEADLKTLLKDSQAAKNDTIYELIDSAGSIGIKFMHESVPSST